MHQNVAFAINYEPINLTPKPGLTTFLPIRERVISFSFLCWFPGVDISVPGSNLLLLRLLVRKGLPTEGLSLRTFNQDMIICPVHYVSCYCAIAYCLSNAIVI